MNPAPQAKTRRHGRRSRPLTAERILGAAMALADSEGLESVSIRNIAAALHARPMSIYDFFESKNHLLSAMANEVDGTILLEEPLPPGWRPAVTAFARKMYAAFVVHPWVLSIYADREHFGVNSRALAKQMAQAAAGLPVEPDDVWAAQGTINDYVLGHTLRAAGIPQPAELVVPSERHRDEFPELAALPDYLRTRASIDRFEFGLQAVLDGLEARLPGLRSGTQTAP